MSKEHCIFTILTLTIIGISSLVLLAIISMNPDIRPMGGIIFIVMVFVSLISSALIIYYFEERSSSEPVHKSFLSQHSGEKTPDYQKNRYTLPVYQKSGPSDYNRYCSNCGAPIKKKFCTQCGNKMY